MWQTFEHVPHGLVVSSSRTPQIVLRAFKVALSWFGLSIAFEIYLTHDCTCGKHVNMYLKQ
jgi:hypothetical protein